MTHYRLRPINLSLPILLAGLVLFGCAEIGPPPGGEVDTQPPELVSTYPENGSRDVRPGREIDILFTEPVVEPSRGKPVYISPRQTKDPKIKWSGNRIRITLDQPFDSNQTYIVSVSSEVRDLRGNRLDSAVTIAFSTGDLIDTGRVAGTILREGKPAAGMLVGLYRSGLLGDSIVYDSVYPTYLTSTSKTGEFALQYLPPGGYRLIGFEDKNHDERLNPGREEFALPDRPTIVGGDLPLDSLIMSMTKYDTLSPAILSAVGTRDGLVRLRLKKSIDMELLGPHPSNLLLRSAEDSLRIYPAQGLLEADEEKSAVLTVYAGSLPEGLYSADLTYSVDQPTLRFDSFQFKRQDDDNPPAIAAFRPDDKPEFVQQIDMRMTFSEPLDKTKLTDQTFVLWRGDSTPVSLTWAWEDPFHLAFTPGELTAGQKYRLDVTEFELVDLAGNIAGDSLTAYPFATLNGDSLGSVSGKTLISIPDRVGRPVMLTFESVKGKRLFEVTADNSQFSLTLPPGKYLLSGFVDQDGNEEKFNGSLFPYRLAETEAFYPDTVAVRARFETAGIEFEFK